MSAKFETYIDKAGEHRFHFLCSKGHIHLVSEGYSHKSGATNGIASVQKNVAIDAHFDLKTNKAGKFYFDLKASNGQIIAVSAPYDTEAHRAASIAEVKKEVPTAPTVEK